VISNEGGSTNFFDSSSAGNALIETSLDFNGSRVSFFDNSSAGNAQIGITDRSVLLFAGNATAAHASLGGSGPIIFSGTSTAGNATIGTFAELSFGGSSKGGRSQIELGSFEGIFIGVLNIDHDVTIGSLAGFTDPNSVGPFVGLGGNLTVGSNNLSTTFDGVIVGSGGLTKIGSGTLTLTGANTYTGDTNINHGPGVLQVDGSITSNTFVHGRGTLAGIGRIDGNISNSANVSPGSAGAPGVLTVVHNYTQAEFATLMIQIAGTNTGEFSVLNVLGSANLDGFLDPVLLNGFVPTIGDSFIFLNYASLTGEFSHIKHQIFDNGMCNGQSCTKITMLS
jgi:autotransporter-associated beta strand protein